MTTPTGAFESPAGSLSSPTVMEGFVSLRDRAEELNRRLEELRDAKDGANTASRLTTRAKQITEYVQRLVQAARSVEALRAVGAQPAIPENYRIRLRTELARLHHLHKGDPNFLLTAEGEQNFRTERRFLQAFADQIEGTNRKVWEGFVAAQQPQIETGLLDLLGRLAPYAAQAAELRRVMALIRAQAPNVPRTVEKAREFASLCARARYLWTELSGKGLSDEVQVFLRALAGGGAPISLLNATVTGWIAENNLEESLRVVAINFPAPST